MREQKLPQRTPRVTEDQMAEICRLSLRQVSQSEIARRVKVHRNTVRHVLDRTHAAFAVNRSLEAERAASIRTYREIQRTAWEAYESKVEAGKYPAAWLAEIRQAQARIDLLSGLEPVRGDDSITVLTQFKTIVLNVINTHAPQLAPVIAGELLGATAPDSESVIDEEDADDN